MSALAMQTRTELTLTVRRGESLLLVLGIPILLLVFFTEVDVLPTGSGDAALTGYLVRSVHSLLQTKLGWSTGLADPRVRLLDPAAGSMNFLSAAWSLATKVLADR